MGSGELLWECEGVAIFPQKTMKREAFRTPENMTGNGCGEAVDHFYRIAVEG
jgi:hypothetical protein